MMDKYNILFNQPFTVTNLDTEHTCNVNFHVSIVNYKNKSFLDLVSFIIKNPDGSINYNYDYSQIGTNYYETRYKFSIELKPNESVEIKKKTTNLDVVIYNIKFSKEQIFGDDNGSRSAGANTLIKLSGNINSLITSDFTNPDVKVPYGFFLRLFAYNEFPVIYADELLLPSTKLSDSCYREMFLYNRNLQTTPKTLPAEFVPQYAYDSMFEECKSINVIPDILAKRFGHFSCRKMFNYCTCLHDISNFPRNINYIRKHAFECTFALCKNLEKLPEYISVKNKLDEFAFDNMFFSAFVKHNNCKNIQIYFNPEKIEYGALQQSKNGNIKLTTDIKLSEFRKIFVYGYGHISQ